MPGLLRGCLWWHRQDLPEHRRLPRAAGVVLHNEEIKAVPRVSDKAEKNPDCQLPVLNTKCGPAFPGIKA